jgi:hypothetical protein
MKKSRFVIITQFVIVLAMILSMATVSAASNNCAEASHIDDHVQIYDNVDDTIAYLYENGIYDLEAISASDYSRLNDFPQIATVDDIISCFNKNGMNNIEAISDSEFVVSDSPIKSSNIHGKGGYIGISLHQVAHVGYNDIFKKFHVYKCLYHSNCFIYEFKEEYAMYVCMGEACGWT